MNIVSVTAVILMVCIVVVSGADPGFGQGGPQLPSEAESREQSEPLAAGVQGPLKGAGSFWVFNAQICIFLHSRDSFSLILTASSTPKNVHYIVFYIIHKKLCL